MGKSTSAPARRVDERDLARVTVSRPARTRYGWVWSIDAFAVRAGRVIPVHEVCVTGPDGRGLWIHGRQVRTTGEWDLNVAGPARWDMVLRDALSRHECRAAVAGILARMATDRGRAGLWPAGTCAAVYELLDRAGEL